MVCSFLFFLLFVSSFWPSVILQLVKCNNFSSFLFFLKLNILSVPQQLSSFISLFSTNSLFFPSGFLPYFVSYSSHLRGPFPGSPFLLEEPFLILSLLLGVQQCLIRTSALIRLITFLPVFHLLPFLPTTFFQFSLPVPVTVLLSSSITVQSDPNQVLPSLSGLFTPSPHSLYSVFFVRVFNVRSALLRTRLLSLHALILQTLWVRPHL